MEEYTTKFKDWWYDRPKWQKYLIVGIIAGSLIFGIVISVVFYSGIYGSIFQAPPPPEHPTGWAVINCKDGYNLTELPDGTFNIMLFYYDTGENWKNVTNGEAFYTEKSTYAFINGSSGGNYYNTTIGVEAGGESETTPGSNTVFMYLIADKNDVSAQIVKIDDNYGNFTAYDITHTYGNGNHTVTIEVQIIGDSLNTARYGAANYLPSCFVPNTTLAYNYSLFGEGTWLGWNGTINGTEIDGKISINGIPTDIYNVSEYNVTSIGVVYNWFQFVVSGYFENIWNLTIYTGLIDNYNSYDVIL